MFVREYGFTITEHDLQRPWMVLSSEDRTIKLPDGWDFLIWAREQWPPPRWSIELDPRQLSSSGRLDKRSLFADARWRSRSPGTPRGCKHHRHRVVPTAARLYDLRSTFASSALAAGVSVFELARVMGTSVYMIERHYGTLLEGASAGIAKRLDAFDTEADACVSPTADRVPEAASPDV
jgi:hypothetical protein